MAGNEQPLNEILKRADMLRGVDRYGDAIVLYEQALALEPENAYVLTCIASSLRMLGALDRAEEYARMAIAVEPDFAWPFLELTLLRLQQHKVDDAYELATQAVQLQANDAYSLTLLGSCAFALDRNEEARILANLAVETEPDNAAGYELLAQVASDEGDLPNAVDWLQQALQINPDDSLLVQRLADAQSALRQNVASVDLYQAALASNPHDQRMQRSLKDSLMRVALFGDAGERRKSAAAVLTLGVFVYLVVWALLYRWVAPGGGHALLNQVAFTLFPLITGSLVFLLRNRAIADRYPQLAAVYRYLRARRRRETSTGIVIVVLCVIGAIALMLRGGIDPLVAFAPLWLPLAFVWVLVLAMPLGLVRAYITDHFVDSTQSLAQQAAQIDRRQQLFLVVVGVVFLGLSVWLQSALPLLVALGTLLGAAMQYYRRRAYRAAIATIVLGLLIARLAPYLPHILDLRPGLLGLLIASLGVMLLLKSATQSVRVLLQRRRMRKLLPTISATKESAKLPLRQQ